MLKPTAFFLLFVLSLSKSLNAQDNSVVIEYINTYKEIAINEMKRTGVPAAIKLAQGIHETEAGTSKLVLKSNNHFGIKCKTGWNGMSVKHTDDAPNECFRSYESSLDSYMDHSDFLKNSTRYSSLFKLDPADYSGWAHGLKKAGYATNPKYPQLLIKLIENYHLQDYTMIALGKLNPADEYWVKQDLAKPVDSNTGDLPIVVFNEKPVVMNPEPELVIVASKKAKAGKEDQELTNPVYPEGEFKINETRVIFAKKGTPYLSIAEKYNLPLSRIFEFNELKVQESVEKDQLIYLMRKRKTGVNEKYVVKEGESLNDIAQAEAIRLESLLENNFLKRGMKPAVGSVLYLKSKAPSMPVLASGK